jgi:hypothetical protein
MPLTLSSAAARSRYVCDALQEGDEIRSIDGLRMDLFLTNCQIKVSDTVSKRVCLLCLSRAISVYRKLVAAACDTSPSSPGMLQKLRRRFKICFSDALAAWYRAAARACMRHIPLQCIRSLCLLRDPASKLGMCAPLEIFTTEERWGASGAWNCEINVRERCI